MRETLSRLVEEGEVDFTGNSNLLIKKKLPDDADGEEIKKLLYKNGYKV